MTVKVKLIKRHYTIEFLYSFCFYILNVKDRISPIRKYQIGLFNDLSLKEPSIPRREPSMVKI